MLTIPVHGRRSSRLWAVCLLVLAVLAVSGGGAPPVRAGSAEAVTLTTSAGDLFLSARGDKPALARRDTNALWTLEPAGSNGSEVRLRHADGGYLHVEHNARDPEIGSVGTGWWSAMWILEPVSGTRMVRIRNKWRHTYLQLNGARVVVAEAPARAAGALWRVRTSDRPISADPEPAGRGVTAIPAGGNAFFNNHADSGVKLTEDGISDWSDASVIPTVYLRLMNPGHHTLSLIARSPQGAVITAEVGGRRERLRISGRDWQRYDIGTLNLSAGYVAIALHAVDKDGQTFPDIQSVEIDAPRHDLRFVDAKLHDTAGQSFYYGRRGATGTLFYDLPQDRDFEWFYSEITVPRGNDVRGSYFEANGCAEGYFGFQVNGPNRRLVLFSVWSPYSTNNPDEVPEDQRVRLISKGPLTTVKAFGGEGAGGQSYIEFPWKSGLTYGFLSRVHPNGDGTTNYSAWFHDPQDDVWHEVATFQRPHTDTWYRSPYSFLENFYPDWGAEQRQALYGNQWARDTRGRWVEITAAHFGVDKTGRGGGRLDFDAGAKGNRFFLHAFGFFDQGAKTDFAVTRRATGQPPEINLNRLPR